MPTIHTLGSSPARLSCLSLLEAVAYYTELHNIIVKEGNYDAGFSTAKGKEKKYHT